MFPEDQPMFSARPFAVFSILLYVAMAVAAGWFVFTRSYQENLDFLAEDGRIRLDQAADRLMAQLSSYAFLVNLLADDPRLAEAEPDAAEAFLLDAVLTYGADSVTVTDRRGRVLVSSNSDARPAVDEALLTAALNGRLGRQIGFEEGRRVIRLSRGILVGQAPAVRAVFVTIDMASLEFEWGVDPEAIAFFDRSGLVFSANRQSLLLLQDGVRDGGESGFKSFPSHRDIRHGEHEIWQIRSARELPREALVVSAELPQVDMLARGFLDTKPARAAAPRE